MSRGVYERRFSRKGKTYDEMYGKVRAKVIRRKQSLVKQNEKHWNWKGGISKEEGYKKRYYQKNKKRLKECMKQWRKNNFGKAKELTKRWRRDNPEKVKEYGRRWQERNPKYKKYNPEWQRWYNQQHKKQRNEYWKNRYKIDLKFNIGRKISVSMRKALRSNKSGKHWENLVGYSLNDLIERLKETMPEGYSWVDVLNGKLHIDHKIPRNAFSYTKSEHKDFKKCWALKNLQLLPAKENIKKGARLKIF